MTGDEITIIPRTRRVVYLAFASFPSTGLKAGDLAYATDRLTMYRWSGSAWQSITIYSAAGATGAKPAAGDLPNGSLYYDSTLSRLEQVQAGAWVVISTPVGVEVATGSYTGNQTARQVTTGFQCSYVLIMNDTDDDQICHMLPLPLTLRLRLTAGVEVMTTSGGIHASDGFSLSNSGNMNKTGVVYQYTAISV
tara:strand:- start:669 stop:1250 length:582 start_codon:yes stop_codon:yes gene_type:complete